MKKAAVIVCVCLCAGALVLYLLGSLPVLITACAIWVISVAVFMIKSIQNRKRIAAVLLFIALCFVYFSFVSLYRVEQTEALAGRKGTVICRVTEEPYTNDGYTRLTVVTDKEMTNNSGLCEDIKLALWVELTESAAEASVGDVIRASLVFDEVSQPYKQYSYSKGVFISAYCESAEIIGHTPTVQDLFVRIRQAVRERIDSIFYGDQAALMKGVLLGETEDMSNKLSYAFKATGVCHITAVSGMHMSILCGALVSIFSVFVRRKTALLAAILPTLAVVAITGFSASAVRAGIMCVIAFLGEIIGKKGDGFNSLGLTASAMLIYNPFYICDLGFTLSCSATAGVIYMTGVANGFSKKINFKFPLINKAIGSIVMVLFQSVGAVVFTLPIQICEFGFVSMIAPVSSVLVCSAVTYLLLSLVVGIIITLVVYNLIVTEVIFWLPDILIRYVIVVVNSLSKVPFSYIPISQNRAMLWLALSVSLIGVWLLLGKTGSVRLISLMVGVLLLVSLWTGNITDRGKIQISSINVEKGFATVIYSGEKCVIIGCGDDSEDAFAIENHIKLKGAGKVQRILLPSKDKSVMGGAQRLAKSYSCAIEFDFAEGQRMDDLENISITVLKTDAGNVFLVESYGRTMLIGIGSYESGISKKVDCVFSDGALPKVDFDMAVVCSEKAINNEKVIYSDSDAVSIKFGKGTGIKVYAEKTGSLDFN